ncbi:sensor histidine kinase [Lysinibacillus yapensis]|uniref:histidine kinase n=1 Tax=Ureibacillus yapensis TaxID=2304605 RepID=A0A396S658_9BACL|nr:sensor histidine kinase [Lysinibacillus yapensis]RHW36152.1 sensor histidine kinase [Lysinibacillus yapensis]
MRNKFKHPTLLSQLIFLISIIVLLTVLSVSIIFSSMIDDIAKKSLGNQAMTVAKMAARHEEIIEAMDDPDPSATIQPIAEEIRKSTGAGYVVIGNKESIRYSHHMPQYIGKKMGTSSKSAIEEGASVIYEGSGISGEAIKAKTPIYKDGVIVGVSSVGFLTDEVKVRMKEYHSKLFEFSVIIILIGIIGAILLARRVKKLIFNLEPEEISFLFKEKEATIESIRDATVAVNKNYNITSINKRARELLTDHHVREDQVVDSRLITLIESVILTKQNLINQKFLFGHQLYMVDAAPIIQKQQTIGAVLTIRPTSEIERFTKEVLEIKSISDSIRAQNHEYLNRLNTIYGLIVLEQYDEAKALISDEVKERQDIVVFLTSSVKDPYIAACLLGKINRSKELKVNLEIDEESNLAHIPESFNSKLFVGVLGNIIDNAMEAAIVAKGVQAHVKISFTDIGSEIIFDIEDNGNGVPMEWHEKIYTEGFTTKGGENHGLGLAIVKNTLDLLHGEIYLSTSSSGGAQFTIVLPKK